jgi:hypothetical protein
MAEKTVADSDLLLPEDQIGNPFVNIENNDDGTSSQVIDKTRVDIVKGEDNHTVTETNRDDNKSEAEGAEEAKESEDEDEDEAVDLESEVELWKFIAQDELYMLLKEDPGRYLPFLESNRELAQKHGCLVTRDDGKLRIKFRIFPEDRWTECGYFDDFDDAIIHQEFSEAVQRSLNMSRSRKNPKNMSRDEYLKDVNQPDSNRAHVNAEIDGITDVDSLRKLKGEQLSKDGISYEKTPKAAVDITKKSETVVKKVEQEIQDVSLEEKNQTKTKENTLLEAYLAQILDKMSSALTHNLFLEKNRNHSLDKLVTNLRAVEEKIPRSLVKDYRRLITSLLVTTDNAVYTYLTDLKQHLLPRNLEPVYDSFLSKLAYHQNMRLGSEWTEEKLYDLLGLNKVDIRLLKEHKVNLRDLWNNSL